MKSKLIKIKDFLLVLIAAILAVLVLVSRFFSKDKDPKYIALTEEGAHVDTEIESAENDLNNLEVDDLTETEVSDFWNK